ncbi:MAG: hypothetical protein HQK75_20410 [Candidatus Magnetomorum sp.]|nr:hypothetical protein [Candidatus Magnetomorum sp.]
MEGIDKCLKKSCKKNLDKISVEINAYQTQKNPPILVYFSKQRPVDLQMN